MTNQELFDASKREMIALNQQYTATIERAVSDLKEASGRRPSTHLGHNLGNRAAELSVIAGKIEQMQALINSQPFRS